MYMYMYIYIDIHIPNSTKAIYGAGFWTCREKFRSPFHLLGFLPGGVCGLSIHHVKAYSSLGLPGENPENM